MNLFELHKSERTAIVGRWTNLALEVYPMEASGFLKRETDRFHNPVGNVTRESLGALFDGLIEGREATEMREPLDGIVRIRAVQDLSAPQAVGFVFLLKRAVREVLAESATRGSETSDLSALDGAIDRLALEAFDLFTGCRETIHRLRIGELKRGAPAICSGALEQGNAQDEGCGGCGA